jgi:hypothetical protein
MKIPSKNNYMYGNPINLVTWSGRLMIIICITDDIPQLLALTLPVSSSVSINLEKGRELQPCTSYMIITLSVTWKILSPGNPHKEIK